MYKKNIIYFIVMLLMIGCGSKEQPPKRFIDKGINIKIIFIPKEYDYSKIKNYELILGELQISKISNKRVTFFAQNNSIYPGDNFTEGDFYDNKYYKYVSENIKLFFQELSSQYKNQIYIWGYKDNKAPFGSYNDSPALNVNFLYIGEPMKLLETINKYFDILEVYK